MRLDSPAGDGIVDFLVNDIADTNSLPDTLYTSDGLIEPVETILNAQTDAVASENNLEVNLSVKAIDGNVYIRLDNPSSEELSLAYVIRSDGKILLPEYNVWTTDRILRPLNEPAYRERFLHIFDTNSSGEYRLVYTTIQNPVKVSEVILKSDPVATIDVTFDVAIDPATFDWRDLSLTRDFGDNLISYPIAIRALSDNTFRLSGLTYLTDQEGRYELKIKTQDILSLDNVAGASVSSITWNRVLEPWDTNSDNIVDLKDFATISEKWMNSDCDNPYWCEGADINRDGAVNFDDILLISNHWLEVID